jgi:TonB family protein
MALITKGSSLTPDLSRELPPGARNANNDATRSQLSDAVGAEIPVVVHASRYSAVSRAQGKNLPPVHEETRTVIIFSQGAVVRLSAMLNQDELVVLTNKQTGGDVICRVTEVKAQPGIQNYVKLEFTQRAPGFWGQPSSPAATPHVVAQPAPLPREEAHNPPQSEQRLQPQVESASARSIAEKPATISEPHSWEPADAELPPTWIELASRPVQTVPAESRPAQRQSTLEATLPTLSHDRPAVQPLPFQAVVGTTSRSKSVLLIVSAAVVLSGVGGTWFFWQRRPAAPATPQPVETSAATVAVPAAAEPIASLTPSAAKLTPNTAKADSLGSTPEVSRKSVPPETVPPPAPVSRTADSPTTIVDAAPRRASVRVGKISKPTRTSRAIPNLSEPPPILETGAAGANPLTENLFTASMRNNVPAPAAPSPAAPASGGQLQQPKLIFSPPAVYPSQARAEHVQGDVTIDALIDATGKVSAMQTISGHPLLRQAAMETVRLWKYQPAHLNGQPIPIHIKVSISFHLQ